MLGFLLLGDEPYMYFSGYDLAWSRYSVMTTLVAEAMQWAIAHRMRLFNLSTGADVSKTRWRPARVDYCGGFFLLGGVFSRNALAARLALRERSSAGGVSQRLRRRSATEVRASPDATTPRKARSLLKAGPPEASRGGAIQ